MNFPANFNPNEPSKFNAETLTTLKLVKRYNPSFVTTFIVDRKEADCLTGEDLRRCENMITLKKKKEINAKYSGLLKSKIKTASYDGRNKNKPKTSRQGSANRSTKVEKPKTPRRGSARGQRSQSKDDKDVKSKNFKSRHEHVQAAVTTKLLNVKEIFKSNVYTNYSASTIDGSAKSPRDIIEKGGSKVKSFWNVQKSTNTLTKAENNKRAVETTLDDRIIQHKTNAWGDHISVTVNSGAENTTSKQAQINTMKISKRTCFSLLNIFGSSECKVLYRNCYMCNRRRKDSKVSTKINSPQFRSGVAATPDKFAEKRVIIESRSTSIGFATSEYAIHRVENATAEHTFDERLFTIHESYVESGLEKIVGRVVDKVLNYGDDKMMASKSSYKVTSVILGLILSFYIIYLMYMKFASVFVIK